MTVTTFLDPDQMPSPDDDQIPFDNKMAAVFRDLPTFGAELNATAANMNSIAAGGAYALPYTFDGTSAAAGDPGAGKLRLNVIAGQSTSTAIYISTTNSLGAAIALTLATFDDSTSAVKGVIKLYKQGDASKWLRFSVTAVTAGTYYTITLVPINGSASNPFVNGDALLLDFQRTGDKGDTGALTPIIHVRDQQASGTNGGTSPASGTVTRTLNTVVRNTIGAGASLASNQVTIPAGTYRIFASAPAAAALNHNLRLIDASDSSVIAYGTTEYAGSNNQSRSVITLETVFATSKTIYLQHYTASAVTTNGLGIGVSSGLCVFSEMFIEKVS